MNETRIVEAIESAAVAGKISRQARDHLIQWLGGGDTSDFRADIARLVESEKWAELSDAFGEVLPFGTGGRRGPMGAGPNRINDRTIGESAQGLASYVRRSAGGRGPSRRPRAVVAYDTRHGSLHFAHETASILAGNGIEALVFDAPRSTPELSFAARLLEADAGVVISASHNPPTDNGFKAYWSDGGQVVPPHDRNIIEEVVRVRELKHMPEAEARASGLWRDIGADVDRAYVDYTAGLCLGGARAINAVFTPLHGTGTTSVWPSLLRAGFETIHKVEAQWNADGDFSRVPGRSPNPEYPSALEAGQSFAERIGADLVLASDPDADRLGAAVRVRGAWRFLNGNQIGVLLADHVIESLARKAALPTGAIVFKTLVTTDLIDKICLAAGVSVRSDLLVGFKYIANAIDNLPNDGAFVFGTEESHGYLRGPHVRDKDAAQAAVLLCERAAEAAASGRTLLDDLDAIHRRHGYYREVTRGVTFGDGGGGGGGGRGSELMNALMQSLRSDPPRRLAGETVAAVVDRQDGSIRDVASGKLTGEIDAAQGNVLVFSLAGPDGDRVTIRPSGTEPKIKVYVQVHADPSDDLEASKRAVDARAEALSGAIETLARERAEKS